MKNISYKTTIVSVAGSVTLLISFALVYFGKATLTEVGSFLGFSATFLAAVGFKFTKDADKTGLPKD